MRLKRIRAVGKFLKVSPVGLAITKQHMHQRAGERPIGPRAHTDKKIGLFRCCVVVGVNNDDFRAPLAPRLERMGHDINLRARCIGAPDNDEVRATHLPRIHSSQTPVPAIKPFQAMLTQMVE